MQGMRKHKLLREDILPAMASNRKVQRLLNEFMDLLSEYENVDPKDSLPSTSSVREPCHEQSAPQQAEKMETDPTVTHPKPSSKLVMVPTSFAPPLEQVYVGESVKDLVPSESKN